MISLDARQFGGSCRCGKDHTMVTRSVLIAPGVLLALEDELHDGSGFRVRLHSAIGTFVVAITRAA